jgi:uncharacterized protein (DUF58 family)
MDQSTSRLPTAFTIPLILFFVGVFLFIALLNRHRDLTVLALLILAMAAGTKIWAGFSAKKIRFDAEMDKQRVYPLETFTLSVSVENAKFLPVLIRMSFPFGKAFRIAGNAPDSPPDLNPGLNQIGSLLWYQRMRFRWKLTALRRGVYRIGPPEISTGDLFGFHSKKTPSIRPIELIVFPRRVPLLPFPVPRRDFFGIPGAKSPVEDPVYVYGLRDYQSGRSARFIHWKASARFNRLQEKICEPAEQEKILLVVEVSQFFKNSAHADFEECLEAAASAAVRFDRSGLAVGFATNGILEGGGRSILPIGRSRGQLPCILETLARLRLEPSETLTGMLRGGLRLPWGASCISFAYNDDEPAGDFAAYCSHRRVPHVSVVCRMSERRKGLRKRHPARLLTLKDILMKGPALVEAECG